MSVVKTGQMFAVETRQMSTIATGLCPVLILHIYLVSTADICPVSAADICPVSTTDICPVSTEDIPSRVVQQAEVCSLSIKSRFLELIPEHNRRRPAQTSADRRSPRIWWQAPPNRPSPSTRQGQDDGS